MWCYRSVTKYSSGLRNVQGSVFKEPESQVLDLLSFCGKHLFVTCLYVEAFSSQVGVVQIVRELEVVDIISQCEPLQREVEQRSVICLQSKVMPGLKDLLKDIDEAWTGESPLDVAFARSGIREGEPDLVNFAGCEKTFDVEYLRSKEPDVGEGAVEGQRTALPKPVAFHIDTDEIAFGKTGSEPHRIFSAAAGKFDGDWLVIFEIQVVPVALDLRVKFFASLEHVIATGNYFKSF